MVTRVNEEVRDEIYRLHLQEMTAADIARKLKMPKETVAWHIRKIEATAEYRLSQLAIKGFTHTYFKVQDSIQAQIRELSIRQEGYSEKMEMEIPEMTKENKAEVMAMIREKMTAEYMYYRIMDMIKERELDIFKLQGDGQSVMALKKKFSKKLQEELDEELNGNSTNRVPPLTA